jgi:hypothetical protein
MQLPRHLHDPIQLLVLYFGQQVQECLDFLGGYSGQVHAGESGTAGGERRSGRAELYQRNPAMKSWQLSSFTWISFTRLVGSIRRSDDIKSPLWVFSGNRVTGMNRRRCFARFSTIAPPQFTKLVVDY